MCSCSPPAPSGSTISKFSTGSTTAGPVARGCGGGAENLDEAVALRVERLADHNSPSQCQRSRGGAPAHSHASISATMYT